MTDQPGRAPKLTDDAVILSRLLRDPEFAARVEIAVELFHADMSFRGFGELPESQHWIVRRAAAIGVMVSSRTFKPMAHEHVPMLASEEGGAFCKADGQDWPCLVEQMKRTELSDERLRQLWQEASSE